MKVQDEKILKIEHKKYLQYINVIIKITTKTLIIKILKGRSMGFFQVKTVFFIDRFTSHNIYMEEKKPALLEQLQNSK
jgi:uncharacterized membrane protein YGL010W